MFQRALEGIGAVVDCRARIHQKVCLIDNRIVWWGSLNALSHMYHSDETMTRAVNAGFASIVAAHMSKRPISVEKAVACAAEAENPRCPLCGGRTVLAEGRSGLFFYCEAECGWRESVAKNERVRTPSGSGPSSHGVELPKKGPACPKCGGETNLRQGPYSPFYGCARYPECDGKARAPRAAATDNTRSGRKARGHPRR